MINFSVPCDFNEITLSALSELNTQYDHAKINEVYGQVTQGEFIASGRMLSLLPKVTIKDLETYMKFCNKYGIKFNYTLNASCMNNLEFDKTATVHFIKFIQILTELGISSFTITLPRLIELIIEHFPEIEIKASAICEITSPDKAKHYKEKGVKRIVVDPDITRRFGILKNIVDTFGDGVEIIINNMCTKNCPYKMFHYNHEAHTGAQSNDFENQYYFHMCTMQKIKNQNGYIRMNWIRPEDLIYYEQLGIRHFKLQGRNNPNGIKIVNTLRHYFDRHFNGNLLDLLTLFSPYNAFQPYINNSKLDGFIQRFYQNDSFCSNLCDTCGYCLEYAKKSIDMCQLNELNKKAGRLIKSMLCKN